MNDLTAERQATYGEAIGHFEAIRDAVLNPESGRPAESYLNEYANMRLHLLRAKETGLPTQKYFRELKSVRRQLRRQGVPRGKLREFEREAKFTFNLIKLMGGVI